MCSSSCGMTWMPRDAACARRLPLLSRKQLIDVTLLVGAVLTGRKVAVWLNSELSHHISCGNDHAPPGWPRQNKVRM
jgi:hypothetical protein